MSKRFALLGIRPLLLPAALSLALLSTAHAAETRVGTRTHAGIQHVDNKVSKLVMTGHPSIDATQIVALEASKPLHVEISLNLRHVDELQAFLATVNQPGSANYRQFLTPAQFKAHYAPTNAQVQAVVKHLEAYGFTNIKVAPNHLLVSADGSAANANAAFNANMKTFNFKGERHFANANDVTVPQSLGGIVDAVLGLQDYVKPHVMSHRISSDVAHAQAAAGVAGHNPTDFPQIYDAGNTPTGSNTVVGIITWGDMTQTINDLNTFTQNAGIATVNTKTVAAGTGTLANDGNPGEWDLDSQDIVAMSGGVKQLIFYAAVNGDANDSGLTDAGITAAYNKAVTDNVAKIINVSLGEDETAANSSGTQAADDKVFAQAVAQGQIFSVSSGDSGVYQWSSDPTEHAPGYVADANGTVQIDLSHYSVSEPASSPNVVAVGGTTLSTNGNTTWAGETVWNEGLAAVDPNNNDNNQRLWATGGGVSLFENAPAWQTTALGSSVTKRQLPDVAFDAASGSGALIVINGQANQQVGGTSLASPLFVGLWARIESANNNSLGLPTQNMYSYFPKDGSPLHDVTSGNNGYNGYGYNAAAGYDNTTGWGSLDISLFNAYVTKYWGGTSGGGTTPGKPAANFTDAVNGLTVNFTNSSTDTGGTISSYAWNFGDNSTSTAASPSHTYAAAGTYTVTLTVTDNTGATSSKSGSVTVSSSSSGGTGGVFSNNKPVVINDNATVTSSIAVSGLSGNASATLKVHANITHNWSGDLTIELVAPNGAYAVLQNPDYGDDGNINTTWTVNASSVPANGTWKLKVIDNDPQYYGDYGTLSSWSLGF
ncbi:protease pro-enzyme activation domain-containing protein [Dyella choica]|uniref:protease pro-enzyme activation domain-containing protein n=1 Tax=Dyella choica TaxID=1927959 RepID=UPI0013158BAE|nr:protease pro-enzyme activation domain-containing protein [Dyella choica]